MNKNDSNYDRHKISDVGILERFFRFDITNIKSKHPRSSTSPASTLTVSYANSSEAIPPEKNY
ncbi:hypothetical protein BOTCAL_0109g00150 [Botryotinia calthae]|uniref:Uncharacterized protein n=1 Tax=Botryotinia calthae TaxID=38488 RepID=A0A4Y8D7S9_9HELO|nr:hypothetical protein BOTCAL_0109g00150 [Botryotinia calthae]